MKSVSRLMVTFRLPAKTELAPFLFGGPQIIGAKYMTGFASRLTVRGRWMGAL